MNTLEQLQTEYGILMSQQQFDTNLLNYTILQRHTPFLNNLALIGNSGITVFDMHKMQHLYTSPNYATLFGYDMKSIEEEDKDYFDSKVHPDDHIALVRNGIETLRFYFSLPLSARTDYKLVSEYRVLNQDNIYVRVIEQHQVLELDANGNIWLSLGVMDIAPNQDVQHGIKSQIINFKTGELVQLPDTNKNEKKVLSARELSVLNLIKDGLYSKEISDVLSISVHTVNTHRQRILEKLNAANTPEAIRYASRLGLIE